MSTSNTRKKSYSQKFRSTLQKLQYCYEHIDDDVPNLPKSEQEARLKLIDLCIEICNDYVLDEQKRGNAVSI